MLRWLLEQRLQASPQKGRLAKAFRETNDLRAARLSFSDRWRLLNVIVPAVEAESHGYNLSEEAGRVTAAGRRCARVEKPLPHQTSIHRFDYLAERGRGREAAPVKGGASTTPASAPGSRGYTEETGTSRFSVCRVRDWLWLSPPVRHPDMRQNRDCHEYDDDREQGFHDCTKTWTLRRCYGSHCGQEPIPLRLTNGLYRPNAVEIDGDCRRSVAAGGGGYRQRATERARRAASGVVSAVVLSRLTDCTSVPPRSVPPGTFVSDGAPRGERFATSFPVFGRASRSAASKERFSTPAAKRGTREDRDQQLDPLGSWPSFPDRPSFPDLAARSDSAIRRSSGWVIFKLSAEP